MPSLSEALTIIISGDLSKFDSAIAQTIKHGVAAGEKLVRAWGDVSRKLAMYGTAAFAGITGAIGTAASKASQFEKSFTEVTTLLTDIPQGGLEGLKGQLKDVAVQFGSSAVTQAQAYYQAVSAGATQASDASALLAASNKLAIGGVAELVPTIKLLASIINAYGGSFQNATEVTDTLFQAVKYGMTTVPELANSMGRVTSIAAQMKIPLEEVSAAIAFLTLKGLDTAEAVTALRGALMETLKPSEEAKELAASLGIELGGTQLAAQGLMPYLRGIAEATQGDSQEIATLFSNVRALNGVIGLTSSGMEKYNEILTAMGAKTGVTEGAFAKMADTMAFKWAQMKAQVEDLWITLGEAFLPVLQKIIGAIGPIVTKVSDWIANNQELVVQIGLWGAGIAAIVAAVGTLGAALAPIILTISSMATAILGVIGAIGLGPLVVVGGGLLVGLIALGSEFVKLGGGIDAFRENPLEALKTAFGAIWDKIKAFVEYLKTTTGLTIPDMLKVAASAFVDFGQRVITVVGAVVDAIAWVIGKISDLVGYIKSAVNWIASLKSPLEYVSGLMEPGFHHGGPVQRRQSGGYVFGPAGIDAIPARLTAGEFVVNRQAMAIAGPIVEAINELGKGRRGAVTVNVTTPAIDRQFVREVLVPELRRAAAAGAY